MRESAPVRFALRLADVPDEFLGRRVGGALDETP
jgi:hypothetical protein